jgi:hypothetical protein
MPGRISAPSKSTSRKSLRLSAYAAVLVAAIGAVQLGASLLFYREIDANTLREDGIVAAAAKAGFKPIRRSLNKAPFYFSRLIAFERG